MATQNTFLKETESLREMRTLEAIEADPSVSQRELAGRLGVAVGVANACVRALVRKGMVKIRGDNNRTITYHLTKKGLLHKSVLAMEWTRNTVDFYRQVRRMVGTRLAELAAEGIATVVLFGDMSVAEIGVVVAPESGVRVLAVVPDRPDGRTDLLGVPVLGADDALALGPDALVSCSTEGAEIVDTLEHGRTPVRSLVDGG